MDSVLEISSRKLRENKRSSRSSCPGDSSLPLFSLLPYIALCNRSLHCFLPFSLPLPPFLDSRILAIMSSTEGLDDAEVVGTIQLTAQDKTFDMNRSYCNLSALLKSAIEQGKSLLVTSLFVVCPACLRFFSLSDL